MTEKQKQQVLRMYTTLSRIGRDYQTTSQLRKDSKSDWGLGYEEALEMAYENLQEEAKSAIKGLKIKDIIK